MAKTITVSYKGTEYKLEYTRHSVEQMESQGFDVTAISTKPMSTLPALFRGAFLAHHKSLKPQVIDEMFAAMGDKMKLLEKLGEMYSDTIESLFDEPVEAQENPGWGTNW